MPSNSYHCKYCHQRKSTETALNRHIAHSAVCFPAYQDDLLRLTSSDSGLDGGITRRTATMHDFMPPDSLGNECDVGGEVLIPDETGTQPFYQPSEETDDVEDADDCHSQSRYRRGYPVRYAVKVLGEGKTKFHIWQEEQSLHGENEWTPFHNEKEWELAQWLIKNVGQKSMDEFLKLPIASMCMHIQSRLTNLVSDSRWPSVVP